MPELPEVEVARRNLERWWVGTPIVDVSVIDPAVFVDTSLQPIRAATSTLRALIGSELRTVTRRAKLLLLSFGDQAVLSHFKMTGKFVCAPEPPTGARAAFALTHGESVFFKDVRRLGWLMVGSHDQLLAHLRGMGLGLEVWPETPAGAELREVCGSTRRAIKPLLLDQSRIAGLGNIAASEILFRAGIDPVLPASHMGPVQWTRLSNAIHAHIAFVIENEDVEEIQYLSEAGANNPFLVYGRQGEPCPHCEQPLRSTKQAGRVTFWCAACQKTQGL